MNDPCLTSFLAAASDDEAWRELEVLLSGEFAALLRDTVTRHLARSRRLADHIDDVLGELRVKLTQKLWSMRAQIGEPIENFRAYCVTAAGRTAYAFLRRQFPERTRLRNRVRYAVTHHPATALEEDAHGFWRCRSTAIRLAPETGSTRALLDSPQRFVLDHGIDPSAALPALIATVLDTCDEPIDFDRLVDAVAALLGISDVPAAGLLERVVDPAASISALLEQRTSLEEVWREVITLPVRQRSALLLNLRDPDGGATLQLLPATSVVTIGEIAVALEIPETELADLWKDLPLDDLAIAARLGATRQQVINLRKSARARLARRLGRNQ